MINLLLVLFLICSFLTCYIDTAQKEIVMYTGHKNNLHIVGFRICKVLMFIVCIACLFTAILLSI